ncbi:MAG: 3-methyl-2-oxobutanoate hydroxymethyltransferase [Gammaproteobacteria bacterium]|nr:3-methyl-2-oxobutanoate hydroxymethyltransferase [Gammaproteobacteria bacterium]
MAYNADELRLMKGRTLIPMLTAYTSPVARCLERAGIPVLLVGDSVGMVEMGMTTTRDVTIEQMCYHVAAVRRGAPQTHVIGDMPYHADVDPDTALRNARLLLAAGADSVKLEGPKYDVIAHLVAQDIAVIGHTGLTPQTATSFKQVGRDRRDADRIIEEAIGIARAGAFMLVIEHTPAELAQVITQAIDIPTIGIGAGTTCDGQVMVINDIIGLGEYWPPFSKQYAYLGATIRDIASRFADDVRQRSFP